MVDQSRNKRSLFKTDIINALKKARISEDEYSIDGYCENCLCIEKTEDGWEIYHGERGRKHDVRTYRSLASLIASVCDRLGYERPKRKAKRNFVIRVPQDFPAIRFSHARPVLPLNRSLPMDRPAPVSQKSEKFEKTDKPEKTE